jgi:hypothetical protein
LSLGTLMSILAWTFFVSIGEIEQLDRAYYFLRFAILGMCVGAVLALSKKMTT